jgi:cytochrome P450
MEIGKQSDYIQASLPNCPLTALCGAVTVIAGMFWMLHRNQRLPPGPRFCLPGLGHLLQLTNNPLEDLRALRKRYGDIFKIYFGNRLVVILNGYEAISEVLQTRGSEFSNRPPSFLAEKLAQNKGLLNTSGKEWTEQKAVVMKSLRPLVASGGCFEAHLETEVERMGERLSALVKNGQAEAVDLAPYIRKSVCSTAFFLVFGRFLDYESRELSLYSDMLEELFSYLNGLAVINFIPYVHLLPGDPVHYHRCLEVARIIEEDLIKPELKHLFQLHASGGIDSNGNIHETMKGSDGEGLAMSIVGGYIEEMEKKRGKSMHTEMNDKHLVKTSGDLMAGGYDSVSNTIQWLVIYLIHNQHVQERCREEVTQALAQTGGHITQVLRSDLVYTQATIMEVQRLANVGPIPPVHSSNHDTTIRDYNIPKDTIIMYNLDSLMMGPHVGDSPEAFRPERFIGADGKLMQPKWFMPFATGSRMCIGASVGKKKLLAFAIGLLSKFKMTATTVDGHQLLPSLKGDLGLTHVPKHFTVCLEPVSS